MAGGQPNPFDALASEPIERDGHVQIISDKSAIEISETEERLYVLNFPRRRPVLNDLHLLFIYFNAVWGDYKP